MTNKLETRFLTELRKRQRQQKRQKFLRTARMVGLVGLGLGLAVLLYAYGASLAVGVVILVLFAISTILKQHNHRHKNVVPISRKKQRYVLGFSLLVMALTYQANPNLLNAPVGNLYVRLAHNPQPQPQTTSWPWSAEQTVHPAIAAIPASAETSINSVAQYIVENETEPQQQVKAIHDYVIQHLSYDIDVLKTGKRPSQEAENVLIARQAVCEGYAKLFHALGQAVGLDVAYVTGDVRRDLAPVDVIPKLYRASAPQYDWTLHAWNAVKVDDSWQLVDTTWDDSDLTYDASYLMPPAKVMIASHLPTLSVWQLLENRQNKRTFEQSPILTPDFFAEGLELVSPKGYTTEIQQTAEIQVKQPLNYQRQIVAYAIKENGDHFSIWDWSNEKPTKKTCQSQPIDNTNAEITCDLKNSGEYQIFLFSLGETVKDVIHLGQLKFHAN